MRPKQPEAEPQHDLFRARLENLVDPRHALVRLAQLIDRGRFEAEFGALYTDGIGRPGLPTRLMVGLHLAAQIAQTERLTGVAIERAYVDRGYRGHDADRTRVFIAGQRRGLTPTIRRERRRRSAIEPVIGHVKGDGHLGRNFLRGTAGDAANAVLAAAGHNLRLLRAWLAWLLAFLLNLLAPSHQTQAGRQREPAPA